MLWFSLDMCYLEQDSCDLARSRHSAFDIKMDWLAQTLLKKYRV